MPTTHETTMPLSEESVRSLLGIIQHMRTEMDVLETRMRTALLEYLPQVGAIREDEDGWFTISSIEWGDDGKPEFVVMDRDGNEDTLSAEQVGAGWEAK